MNGLEFMSTIQKQYEVNEKNKVIYRTRERKVNTIKDCITFLGEFIAFFLLMFDIVAIYTICALLF